MEGPTIYYKNEIELLKKALKEAVHQRDESLSIIQGHSKELDETLIKIAERGDKIIQSILNGEDTNGL